MPDAGRRGIAWAGAVNLAGGVTGASIGLLLAAVVSRQLGTDGAGAYFLVVAAFMIVSNVAELGADTGLVRFVSAARATGRPHLAPHLVVAAVRPVALVGSVAVAAAAVWAALTPARLAGLPAWFVVAAVASAVLSSLIAVLLAATRGLGDVVAYPLLQNVALPVLRLACIVAVLVAGGGTTAVLLAWIAPVPVVLVICILVVIVLLVRTNGSVRRGPLAAEEQRRVARDFWSFSAARGLSSAAEILLEWSDVIIVGVLASPQSAGVYAVVTRCARAGEVVQQAARIAIGPQISEAMARGATGEAGRLYGGVTAAMIWLSWPFYLIVALFADALLSVFGQGFERGAVALAVLSGAMALAAAAGTVQTILLMGGRSRWQLADKSVALVINIGLNLVLVPFWGIEGAAVAWAVTILVDTAIVVHQVQHLMGVRPAGRPMATAAALAVAVVGGAAVTARMLWGDSVTVMLVTAGVAGAVYLALSIPLRHRLGLVDLARSSS